MKIIVKNKIIDHYLDSEEYITNFFKECFGVGYPDELLELLNKGWEYRDLLKQK